MLDTIKVALLVASSRAAARGAPTPPAPIRPDLVRRRDRARPRRRALSAEELTALFAETRPEAIEDMRQAADELRAELAGETVTFVVNRNINVSNVCTVGCAFCGFGQGKRSPDAYEHDEQEFVAPVHEALEFGATELCIQSGIHPDWTLEDYLGWLRLAKRRGRGRRAICTCTPTARWRSRTCATSRGCRRRRSSRGCARPAWARRRAPRRRCCTTASASGSPPTSCRSRAG